MDIQPIAQISEIKKSKKINPDEGKKKQQQPLVHKIPNNTQQNESEEIDVQHIDERV